MVIDSLIFILAAYITFPFLMTISLYLIGRRIWKVKTKVFHFSISYSALFYVLAVWAVGRSVFEQSVIAEVIILLIILMALSVFVQWKVSGEIIFSKVWKGFWRLSFLIFGLFYSMLILVGVINSLF